MKQRVPRHTSSACSTSATATSGQRHSLSRPTTPGLQYAHRAPSEGSKHGTYASYSIRQVAESASQLASSPPLDSAGLPSTPSGLGASAMTAVRRRAISPPKPIKLDSRARPDAEASEVASGTSERETSLNFLFDDIQSDLRSQGPVLPQGEAFSHPSDDPPKICRAPAQVLPRNVAEKPFEPVAALPELPRSIHRRPQLFPNFATHIHPADEWLLHPQPPSAVAARLRSDAAYAAESKGNAQSARPQATQDPWYHPELTPETGKSRQENYAPAMAADRLQAGTSAEEVPWTPGRLISLLRALSTAGYHAAACELLVFLFEKHPALFTSLDLSRQAVLGCVSPHQSRVHALNARAAPWQSPVCGRAVRSPGHSPLPPSPRRFTQAPDETLAHAPVAAPIALPVNAFPTSYACMQARRADRVG